MSNDTREHPNRDDLVAFGLGKLEPNESAEIAAHLDGCAACCETLLDLQDDTFVHMVKSAPTPRPIVDATLSTDLPAAADLEDLPAALRNHARYRVVKLIGKGGMGAVYWAEHRLMNRPVALKVIHPDLVQNAQAVERFRREVRAAARLDHPNIVTAHDAEQAGDVHFLVMEFVAGTDLASVVQQHGPMAVAQACDCIRQTALGLQHAHELGMVHRDIKPHNLMLVGPAASLPGSADDKLEPCRTVKILDFGLASFAAESALLEMEGGRGCVASRPLTSIGSVMGTPDYIAPEQAVDAHAADIRSDVYSLGCTLCYLLTGKTPFAAHSVVDKLKAHAEQPPPVLEALRNDIPVDLAEIVSRMLAKDPAERFQTPAEVAAALAPFADAAAPPRKRTLRNALVALAAILLAGVLYVTTDQGRVEIRTEVDDVDIVVSRGGKEVSTIDLATGSRVTWMPSGDYAISLKQDRNDIRIENGGFTLSRWGKQIVSVTRVPPSGATATAADDQRLPGKVAPTPLPPAASNPHRPERRTGLLASPPTLRSGGLPVGQNLIADPSLEGTPTGELPPGWFAWLDDGPNFKCEVVEGGVTGKHCLQISGGGTRGVVFATTIPLDRTKRFTLTGRVKVEGEPGTWAVIKLNFFNKSGWLGVDDRVGVTPSEFDWKLLEKTDAADQYPAATWIVPTCHIEGNGTAWFDDLEVIAYDRDTLPADFDAKHGRNNRMK